MSTATAKTLPSTAGNPARALPGRTAGNDAGRKARTPLSVVRGTPGKRRLPFAVLIFGFLAAALLVVLVLNISVSTAQYELVRLKAAASTLGKQNQDLTQQKHNFEAPQNLAAKAAELGMVAAPAKGQIDLGTMAVSGKATPALKGANPGAVIAAPALSGQLDVVPPPASREPLENRKPSDPAGVPVPSAPSVPAAPAEELHGGSVPVPQQTTPGQ